MPSNNLACFLADCPCLLAFHLLFPTVSVSLQFAPVNMLACQASVMEAFWLEESSQAVSTVLLHDDVACNVCM